MSALDEAVRHCTSTVCLALIGRFALLGLDFTLSEKMVQDFAATWIQQRSSL
jgi:hypothetical protein